MSIANRASAAVNTANAALTSGATNLAGRATGFAARGGILGKAAGLVGSGLKLFAGLSPIGKAATLAVGALGLKAAVSSHPAGNRVG